MSTKRRVEVSEFVFGNSPLNNTVKTRGEAVFHEFIACAKNEHERHCVARAIIEWPDGGVEHVDIKEICFLDSEVQHEQS